MNLDELQSVRDRERQTDKLQQLRESFYEDAGEFIHQLRDQREHAAERADDPFDAPEVSRLSDEIDTAEQTVEAIYEKRVGKIVKAASFAAADLPAESDGMTAEEQDLFDTLVADIKTNRQHVMDVLDGVPTDQAGDTEKSTAETPADPATETGQTAADAPETSTDPADTTQQTSGQDPASKRATETPADDAERVPPEPSDPQSGQSGGDSGVSAADVMGDPAGVTDDGTNTTAGKDGSASTPDRETHRERDPKVRNDGGETATEDAGTATTDAGTTASVDRETVRITAEVGDFLGVDEREYDLAENDVVRLPATNVDPLVKRDAAERLD